MLYQIVEYRKVLGPYREPLSLPPQTPIGWVESKRPKPEQLCRAHIPSLAAQKPFASPDFTISLPFLHFFFMT
jgi:hypothetical protein